MMKGAYEGFSLSLSLLFPARFLPERACLSNVSRNIGLYL